MYSHMLLFCLSCCQLGAWKSVQQPGFLTSVYVYADHKWEHMFEKPAAAAATSHEHHVIFTHMQLPASINTCIDPATSKAALAGSKQGFQIRNGSTSICQCSGVPVSARAGTRTLAALPRQHKLMTQLSEWLTRSKAGLWVSNLCEPELKEQHVKLYHL